MESFKNTIQAQKLLLTFPQEEQNSLNEFLRKLDLLLRGFSYTRLDEVQYENNEDSYECFLFGWKKDNTVIVLYYQLIQKGEVRRLKIDLKKCSTGTHRRRYLEDGPHDESFDLVSLTQKESLPQFELKEEELSSYLERYFEYLEKIFNRAELVRIISGDFWYRYDDIEKTC